MTFKTSPDQRSKARQRAQAAKADAAQELRDRIAAFQADHAAECAYLAARQERWNFAASMLDALARFGSLTERQLAAVQNAMARDAERKAARDADRAQAPAADVAKVQTALTSARDSGLKYPKLRLSDFTFSLASATSANAGAVYVKSGETYLGKVAQGRFHGSRDCNAELAAAIIAAAADPAAAAKAYGLRTGSCSCCGRTLTDPVSIEAGIGPICASRFAF